MFARLTAKAVLATIAIAMAFFGIGLLGLSLVSALVKALGPVGGYALAGAILLLPPLCWALYLHLGRPQQKAPPQNGGNELTKVLLAAVAKETPWIAIIGAGLAGMANMFVNRSRLSK